MKEFDRKVVSKALGVSWDVKEDVFNVNVNIKNKKRLKVYVANRGSMIHCLSEAGQWRFVPGKKDPADFISRGMSPKELKNSKWKESPDLLIEIDDGPVHEEDYGISIEDDEVKKDVMANTIITEGKHPIDEIIDHYSSWYAGSTVHKSSSIRNVLPMMNEDSVLCVGGRLKNMKCQEVCKHPCILPHDHPVTRLIIVEYHERAHQGTEWTLSLLRNKFWITRSRGIIKQVKHKCVVCKKVYDQPRNQHMADTRGKIRSS